MLILSVFDRTGVWSQPYRDAGYHVVQVDLQLGDDVRLMQWIDSKVHGIILQPPCDHFAVSGARWWDQKGTPALLEGLELVRAGLSLVALYDAYLCEKSSLDRLWNAPRDELHHRPPYDSRRSTTSVTVAPATHHAHHEFLRLVTGPPQRSTRAATATFR